MNYRVLITGVSGQDGYYLAELLLEQGHTVFGLVLPSETELPDHFLKIAGHIEIVRGDLADIQSIENVVKSIRPDQVYNLAGQSNVALAEEIPLLTNEINGLGPIRILEAIRQHAPEARFFQASSSEIFGNAPASPQTEETDHAPRNVYGWSKLQSHQMVRHYREKHGIFACAGILYNHESPLRPEAFVTRKITQSAAKIKRGLQKKIVMGNTSAIRDWGYAKDYVKAFSLMLEAEKPEDYIISSGAGHTVEDFLKTAFQITGLDYRDYIEIDQSLYRENEKVPLIGSPIKIEKELGWKAAATFKELVELMVKSDLEKI